MPGDEEQLHPLDAICRGRVGTTLNGKWSLDRLIGVGGMAAVYQASHRNGAASAIKILHPEFSHRADVLGRFLREAYIANKAGRGAVAVLDDDVDAEGMPYLVMELLRGETVEDRVEAAGGRLPVAEVLWIATEVLTTLEQAHKSGIIHRDLKPENLFWTHDRRIKVLDFGIARLHEPTRGEERTRAGTVMGTLGYMAREQAIGITEEIDGRTDLFAVGAIMWRLLTGKRLHEEAPNELVAAATQAAPPLVSAWPDAPPGLARVLGKALAFERADRYPDAHAMKADLEALSRAPRVPWVEREPTTSPSAHVIEEALSFTSMPPSGDFARQMSEADAGALRRVFALVEAAVRSMLRHGRAHADVRKAFVTAWHEASEALAGAHIGLFWNVVPTGFVARSQELVWAPSRPVDQAVRNLHAKGVAMLGFLPGLTEEELTGFAELLLARAGVDAARVFESKRWEHVVHRIELRAPPPPRLPTLSSKKMARSMAPAAPAMSPREIAGQLRDAKLDGGLALVDALVALGTDEAKRLLLETIPALSAPLRVAAMASVDAEKTRAEVRRALDDGDAGARAATLQVIERRKVRAAGPLLALRARAPEFDELSPKERRDTLAALASLTPSRAEEIGIELLSDTRLFRGSAREKTRELAAEMLGRVGTTAEARDALANAAKGRLHQTEGVRAAAARALAVMTERQASAKPASNRTSKTVSRAPHAPVSRRAPGASSPPVSRRKATIGKGPPSVSRRPPSSRKPR